jgi:hypothetical protein
MQRVVVCKLPVGPRSKSALAVPFGVFIWNEMFFGLISLTQEHSYEVSSPDFFAKIIPKMLLHSPEEKIQLVPQTEHILQPL